MDKKENKKEDRKEDKKERKKERKKARKKERKNERKKERNHLPTSLIPLPKTDQGGMEPKRHRIATCYITRKRNPSAHSTLQGIAAKWHPWASSAHQTPLYSLRSQTATIQLAGFRNLILHTDPEVCPSPE